MELNTLNSIIGLKNKKLISHSLGTFLDGQIGNIHFW